VFKKSIEESGIKEEDIESIISTGYGRRTFKKAKKVITEISAVAIGSYFLSGKRKCIVIDVGGQDTKVVEVGENGEIIDFLMNDKCAAGTGRFLEMMANVFGINIEEFSNLALNSKNPVKINSTCSVFAESEVVSLITSNTPKEDIAGGLFISISSRIAGMVRQFPHNDNIVFCGGGAKIPALKLSLEKILEKEIIVLPEPQFVVAFGAALSE
ncbi:MAG: acyl-CoA dehydratase activase, partial [bacterium]|nr:acyl-CoA dehydratase activase [bacterium]MDW8164742.1 acyl-CoA dehydratase activase [Candidatus Omnitrophota bacterium]